MEDIRIFFKVDLSPSIAEPIDFSSPLLSVWILFASYLMKDTVHDNEMFVTYAIMHYY